MRDIVTRELADFLRAAVKMLGGKVLDEESLYRLVESGHQVHALPIPGKKLRDLTPLEVECILLEGSLGLAAAEVVASAVKLNGFSHYAKLHYASILCASAGATLSTILAVAEIHARQTGLMPEGADTVSLEIADDALCLFAAKKIKSEQAAAERISR
ncbi:MAG: hypothetical protein IJT83_03175, partial [Victivallales bacterium]|nr:hypothetical protein [Victivallales bacterium]